MSAKGQMENVAVMKVAKKIETPLSKAAKGGEKDNISIRVIKLLREKGWTDEEIMQKAQSSQSTINNRRYELRQAKENIPKIILKDGKKIEKIRGEKKAPKSAESKAVLNRVKQPLSSE